MVIRTESVLVTLAFWNFFNEFLIFGVVWRVGYQEEGVNGGDVSCRYGGGVFECPIFRYGEEEVVVGFGFGWYRFCCG